MARRGTIPVVLALVFIVVNVAGLGYAIAMGEARHGVVHVVLLASSIRMLQWTRRRREPSATELGAGESAIADRLASLERSMDAVAVEVERIGEGQRFVTRLLAEEPPTPAGRTAARPDEPSA